MELKENKVLSEQDIDFFKERRIAKLLKQYYTHKEKSIDELIELKKNIDLANKLADLLKTNENDVELIHSKRVILEYCLNKFKNIKKEDLEVAETERKLDNINKTTTKIEEKESDINETDIIHENVTSVLKKYYEMKEC